MPSDTPRLIAAAARPGPDAANPVARASELSTALILAFLSGYVDAAVFVHMQGLFVAHVTGNFVLLGATLVELRSGGAADGSTVLKLAAFPVFFVAAALSAVFAGRASEARRTRTLLWSAALLIGGVALAALAIRGGDEVLSMLLVVAMAALNAAQRMDPGMGPPFTIMTGNVTSVAIAAARRLGLAAPADAPARDTPATMLTLVLGFAVGCALGAVSQVALGLEAMILPAVLLAGRLLIR